MAANLAAAFRAVSFLESFPIQIVFHCQVADAYATVHPVWSYQFFKHCDIFHNSVLYGSKLSTPKSRMADPNPTIRDNIHEGIKENSDLTVLMKNAPKETSNPQAAPSSRRMFHIVTNPHILFVDENGARCHAHSMGAFASGGSITSAGSEVHELARMNGQ